MVCRISKRCCQLIRSTETRSTTYEPAKHFVNSAIDQNVITLQQKTRFSVQICQKLAQTHFLFHEYTVKYALTRISGSHIVNCGYSYKMPLICRGLIWFRTMLYSAFPIRMRRVCYSHRSDCIVKYFQFITLFLSRPSENRNGFSSLLDKSH